MQILLMTSPTAPVREFHLSRQQIISVLIAMVLVLVGVNWFLSSLVNQTRDALLTVNQSNYLSGKEGPLKDADYERKLHELQARLDEAQINLDQLAALKEKLKQFSSSTNDSGSLNLSAAQGGPLRLTRQLDSGQESYGVRLDRTIEQSIGLSTQVLELRKAFAQTQVAMKSSPSGLPLPFEVAPSSGLGYRIDPFTNQLAWHDGTDFPAPNGTPILATANGIVIKAGWGGDYGNMVEVKHPNGYITRYAHAQELSVQVGQAIKKSQVIGKSGSTGRSTGPHLHYEIFREGVPAS
ncbi:M23 family metallopeptidase [Polynucleobacter sp. AP-Melu-500A-A1]|uniref:M23 family metallopeptidase n=1 Tax=Polynucleobacter sp. AP-Melu-500A-A1 TaxID=2576929 RepID=UPI001C0AAD54|nr:M23 family metallopeptidase [Polynucleobacter sp. AP-Melu-500A-A1]MBU3630703.1 peptidoglycan DD-metalloendopeptidase family protein [Polynucleobacter sp. AP-Melu-500A-A1]